ncbi:hypothetical protein G9P44_003183 [Scheffersomyces stipitis]|nr:hypothetical protein G9P44_003183 [Scheffersomyces stipitis]
MEQKRQRQRNRVPVSCLNCKKRKVKCDKGKPSCSGCIKNGVPHLCEYLEPVWSKKSSQVKAEDAEDSHDANASLLQVKIEETSEFKQFRAHTDKVILSQRKEIDDLKRQLSVLQQLSPKVHDATAMGCKPILILTKLNLSLVNNRDPLTIHHDPAYSVIGRTSSKVNHIDTYSWINLIKLDPQLTTLWFKITNLQKIYHMYKMNMLNNTSRNSPGAFSLPNQSVTSNPLSKKSPYRINEIDFTYSVVKSEEPNKLRCPVIECDFNFMTEDQITPSPVGGISSPVPSARSTDTPRKYNTVVPNQYGTEQEQFAYHDLVSEKGRTLLLKVQNLWDSSLNLVRGNEKINFKQLYFLIDFYFNNKVYDIESRHILSFYKIEIQSIIKKNGNEISINIANDPSLKLTDEQLFERLKMKGVYLCMLALIIEESLDTLRSNVKVGLEEDIGLKFRSLFPTEVVYVGQGSKFRNTLYIVQEFVLHITNLKFSETSSPSLCTIACYITLLNREVAEYKKDGATSDPKPGFTSLFTVLLKTILSDEGTVELWKDPELVIFKEQEARKRNRDLKIHMCYIWTDLVRLANLVGFNFVPLIKHSEAIDNLLQRLYTKIEEADSLSYHLKYITSLNSHKFDELTITLHLHYLIARISSALAHGISKVGDLKLTIANLESLIRQCSTWIVDLGLRKLRHIRRFECVSMLMYLRYFMKYIILLQAEESMDEELVASSVPDIFTKYLEIIDSLRKELINDHDGMNKQYVLSAITELLTRLIQIIVALLMRVSNDDNMMSQETVLRIQLNKYSAFNGDKAISDYGMSMEDLIKTHIVGVVEDSVDLLAKSPLLDKDKSGKLSKLWKFYLTFVRNSKRMTSINYAKIHANIPQFRGIGAAGDMKSCPVITPRSFKNSTPPAITSKEYTKCPISHITTPIDEDSSPIDSRPGKCPVNHSIVTTASPVPVDAKKRKCPFDHTALDRSSMSQGYNAIESNIRGVIKRQRDSSDSPSDVEKSSGSTPVVERPEPVVEMSNVSISETRPDNFPPPNLGFDLQAFNDFDFDFLQSAVLLDQIEFGNSDAGNIEGFFQ